MQAIDWVPVRRPFGRRVTISFMHKTSSAAADPVVRVRGLIKRYGDVRAVDGIDFEVA